MLSSDPLVTLDVWRRIKQLSDPNSRQVTLLWTPVRLFRSLSVLLQMFYFGTNFGVIADKLFVWFKGIYVTTAWTFPPLFLACSSHGKHPRLLSSVVAGRPKLDQDEGQWTNPGRGLHRSRAVWLHCAGCSPHRVHHPCSHHCPTEGRWRWATVKTIIKFVCLSSWNLV